MQFNYKYESTNNFAETIGDVPTLDTFCLRQRTLNKNGTSARSMWSLLKPDTASSGRVVRVGVFRFDSDYGDASERA